MRKIILTLAFLLIPVLGFSQNKAKKKINEPSKLDTEQWISENISSFAMKEKGHSYDLYFNDGILLIKHISVISIPSFTSTVKADYFIPIKEISKVRFETLDDAVLLKFVLKNNAKVKGKYETDNYFTYDDDFRIVLSNAFQNDDMINRMTKAFNNLIKFNGGSVVKNTY